MKLAVSNIAWSAALDAPALELLHHAGIAALEVAPTRVWPDWEGASVPGAHAFRAALAADGFSIPSLQAILFAKPDAKLFGSDAERATLAQHLRLCADLAAAFGAKSLVFGAPKNRDLRGTDPERAFELARELFREAGHYYAQQGVYLCLEANPEQYASTFITDSREADRLVRAVASDGFRLHLDTACMFLAGEDLPRSIAESADILQHFHVSEPYLGGFTQPQVDHARVACALRSARYSNWISLEMRETSEDPLANLRQAVHYVQETYRDAGQDPS